jgi:intracellular septation protein A
MTPGSFEVPGFRAVVAHAMPTVVEATLIPLVLFTVALHTLGVGAAVATVVGWSALILVRRVRVGRRIPGVMVLGGVAVIGRAATVMVTGSTFLFFLQPVIGTVVTGLVFLLSVPLGRPLVARLAGDFVPLPAEVFAQPAVRRLLEQLSLMWAVVHFANAGLTLFLLQRESVGTFVLMRPVVSLLTTGTGIVVTVVAARRVLGVRRRPSLALAAAVALPAAA